MSEYESFLLEEFKQIYDEVLKKSASLSIDLLLSTLEKKHDIRRDQITNLSVINEWYKDITELDYLNSILEFEDLQEIIIHNIDFIDVITRKGKQKISVKFLDTLDFIRSLEYLARKENVKWNLINPFVSFDVCIKKEKYRFTVIHQSIGPTNCPKVFIRKINNGSLLLEDFSCPKEVRKKIEQLVKEKKNIVVSGSTASGKTSFLKTLTKFFSPLEHIITIEDTHELQGPQEQYTQMISGDIPGKSMKDYCAYAMRMSPDRLILGEIRSDEIVSFILAMNTGHKGLLSTIHANNGKDTLLRLSMLFSIYSNIGSAISHNQILKLICSNVDYVIHLENKEVNEIIQVMGSEDEAPIFNIIYRKPRVQSEETLSLDLAS